MKKRILIPFVCILSMLCCPLCAATFVDAPESDIVNSETHTGSVTGALNISLDLALVPQSIEVGFSSATVNDFNVSATLLERVALSEPVVNGCFSNDVIGSEVYIYWKILSTKQPAPKITLTIKDAMKNISVPDKFVDWKVSWSAQGTQYSIDSSVETPFSNSADVEIEPVDDHAKLNFKAGSIKLLIETITSYWTVPSASYEGDLTIEITGV